MIKRRFMAAVLLCVALILSLGSARALLELKWESGKGYVYYVCLDGQPNDGTPCPNNKRVFFSSYLLNNLPPGEAK